MKHRFCEPAYDDWFAEIYDDWYPELSDPETGPYRPIKTLLSSWHTKKMTDLVILDAACGTGNLYRLLSNDGYKVWATDGSAKMLAKAQYNCRHAQVDTARLVRHPVAWTDRDGYARQFLRKGVTFDLILLASNSFCHLPPVDGHMDAALRNFYDLLKPGGRLVIDTKKYRRDRNNDAVPIIRELRFVKKKWIPRTTRVDPPRKLEAFGPGEFELHTSLHYDIDPCFRVCRALIVVTIVGADGPAGVRLFPYFPLPASQLTKRLRQSGFSIEKVYGAKKDLDWSYDVVVGKRTG